MGKKNRPVPQQNNTPAVQRKNLPGKNTTFVGEYHFSGPLPPPDVMQGYQNVGILNEILKLAMDANERENRKIALKEREEAQKEALIAVQVKDANRSSICQAIIQMVILVTVVALAVVIVLSAGYALFHGNYLTGSIIGAFGILTPVILTLLPRKK